MKRILVSFFILLTLFPLNSSIYSRRAYSAPPPPDESSSIRALIKHAVLEEAMGYRDRTVSVPYYDIEVENIILSEDNSWASSWIVFTHPQTGEVIPTEPITALANWEGESWVIYLPSDPNWKTMLLKAPDDILSDETRSSLFWMNVDFKDTISEAPIGGYLLPWEGGNTVYVSQSLAHDKYITSGNAHYSFDFYIPQTMFGIHAAKAGTVWLYKDDVPNGYPDNVNYIVLRDAENPSLYQLYLHLAQNSIPQELKSIGAPVAQGQFIGVADDTGQSTGHHLHFQVENSPYWLYWGVSVDITFDDVYINGGRPRVLADLPYCRPDDICDDTQSSYISENYGTIDPNPPIGNITVPTNGITLNNDTVNLEGWAFDDSGVTSARFKANYGSAWIPVSPWFTTSTFNYTWDLCDDQVPDGPLSLALDVRDGSGRWADGIPGLQNIIKNYTCPTPTPECIPGDNQVTLFSDPDYAGSCVLLGIGNHIDLGSVGPDNIASVLVGSNVRATLYMDSDFSGRGETFFTHDSNLIDNRIGTDSISSLRVGSQASLPNSPAPSWPENYASFPRDTSISLVWEDVGGANEFLIDFNGETQTWQPNPAHHLSSLTAGTYSWKLKARNINGESDWSADQILTIVDETPDPIVTHIAPFSDDMESGYNGWKPNPNWDQAFDEDPNHAGDIIWRYEVSTASVGYDNGIPNIGDLTSPAITIPDDGNEYYLRFWYLYETEGPGGHWDQRWIQLSVDGAPFTNLLQLFDDPPNYWSQSPAISLADYAGSNLRFRFHFETLDAAYNTFKGWYIDDFSVTTTPPSTCPGTGEPNNSPLQAQAINYNNIINAEICPGGDVDYFQFDGVAGDQIGITTVAQTVGSALDTYVFLLDSNESILAENDDILLYELRDSSISYKLPSTGTYYIKVRAWNHPSVGGENYTYTLHLFKDPGDPNGEITSPLDNTYLHSGIETITVSASDTGSGISHVDFYWHSGNWQYGNWEFIGSDWDVGDGWSINFDTSALHEQSNIAFYAQVHDWGGNSIGTGVWNLMVDHTPPVTSIQTLPASHSRTAILVQWEGNDDLAGIDHYDLQVQIDQSSWEDWLTNLDAESDHAWFVGEMSHTYGFRMRGVDRIGNSELYPSSSETSTVIPADICSGGDIYENDNSPGTARSIINTSSGETHNFCNPTPGSDWINDEDWFKIILKAGNRLFILANPQDASSAVVLSLYASNGSTLLYEDIPTEFGEASNLTWQADLDTTLYLQITHIDGRVLGDTVSYDLNIHQGNPHYLPVIIANNP